MEPLLATRYVFTITAHVAGIVEQLSLQLNRQCIPLHNKRSPETSQDCILLGRESGTF